MDDLEITRRCAEAMGGIATELPDFPGMWLVERNDFAYAPLHDDAQAMALVKRFDVSVHMTEDGYWFVTYKESSSFSTDLNRAICLAVAQRGKE